MRRRSSSRRFIDRWDWWKQMSVGKPTLVVALGASNTAGYGVGVDVAFPAVIQRLLQDRGIDVQVVNSGVPGQTTAQMLARLTDAVPNGACMVIFQPGSNDARLGIASAERERNIATITSSLHARGIAVIRVEAAFATARPGNLQSDGIHFTAAGHRKLRTSWPIKSPPSITAGLAVGTDGVETLPNSS